MSRSSTTAGNPEDAPGSGDRPGARASLAALRRTGSGRLSPHLSRARSAIRGQPAVAGALDGAVATWWRLVDAFCDAAAPVLARFFPDRRLVAVAAADGTVALHRVVDGNAAPLGPLEALAPAARDALTARRWSAVELRLPDEQVMRRTLQLPAASRAFIGPILDHRLERLTPWRPDKVLYGFTVGQGAAAAAGTIDVTLLATSRDLVAPTLARLGDAGLAPTAVGAAGDRLEAPLAINLMETGPGDGHDDARRWVSRAAIVAFMTLGLLAGASAWLAAGATDEQAAVSHKLVRARHLLRSLTIGPLGPREQAMIGAKQPDRATVVLVDRLAAAIPADTYLTELAVTPDKVRLGGVSGNAPALVADLEKAGLLNPRFTSAITREKSGKDAFEITADRRPAAKEDDAP